MKDAPNLRLLAARIIDAVTDGRSLTDCLESSLPAIKESRDRAFVQALCYGVCRYYSRLDVLLSYLLKKPMKAKDSDIHALLLIGLYQLMAMRIPEYAAVTETVSATETLKKPWSRGLVNAVMRAYLRNKQQFDAELKWDRQAHYAHPMWWINALKKAWPQQWQEILEANNTHPPFSLRVNQQHLSREKYVEILQTAGHAVQIIPETQSGIILDSPLSVEELPGFFSGDISVQDGAAQLAAELLEVKKAERILDACASPGGKLTHILELEPHVAALIAVEKNPERMQAIEENLRRLKLHAQCICQDVNATKSWWDGQLFERILLDAPCSASGVIRRHPDIKLLRQPTDIHIFAKEQLQLLTSLWPLLAQGGLLVYATCSIFPEENTHVLKTFLAANADAQEEKIHAAWGIHCEIGRQILPGMHHMDGFYFARVRKTANVL